MIGAIAGAIMAAGGAAYSGYQSAQANKRRRLYLDQYDRDSQNEANRDIYQDYTQTATAQAENTRLRKLLMESNESLAGQQAVMGGNRAAVAEAKNNANNTAAQYASNVTVNGETLANQAKTRRAQDKQWVAGQRMAMESESAQQNAKAGSQLIQSGLGLAVADMQSTLNNGKGLFGDKFGKSNSSANVIGHFSRLTNDPQTQEWMERNLLNGY